MLVSSGHSLRPIIYVWYNWKLNQRQDTNIKQVTNLPICFNFCMYILITVLSFSVLFLFFCFTDKLLIWTNVAAECDQSPPKTWDICQFKSVSIVILCYGTLKSLMNTSFILLKCVSSRVVFESFPLTFMSEWLCQSQLECTWKHDENDRCTAINIPAIMTRGVVIHKSQWMANTL